MNAIVSADRLILIDAKTAEVETNVRTDVNLDEAFLATIREYGIVTPVLGRRDDTGKIWIRAGQRRHAAALQLDVPLPVFFYESNDAAAVEPAWAKTHIQLIENDNRKELTHADRVQGWNQMHLDGLSPTKLAGVLGETKENVKAALAIVKSPKTLGIAAEWDLDLVKLAALAEFEAEEDADLLARLVDAAYDMPEQFDHNLARARDQKETRVAIAVRRAELEAEGKTVYTATQLNDETVVRAAYYNRDESIEVDPELGEGLGIVISTNYNGLYEVEVIHEPETHGYVKRNDMGGSDSNTGPRTEEQKAERRHIINCHRAWDSCEIVRLDWLTNFFAKKTFPKDVSAVMAIAITRHSYELNSESDDLGHDFLHIEKKHGSGVNALAELVEENPAKAGLVTLAVIIGKLESGTNRDSFRYIKASTRFYLRTLRDWGYTLSPVELIALGELETLPGDQAQIDQTVIEDTADVE